MVISASAGVRQSSVLRGLVLRAMATAAGLRRCAFVRSVPFGKYCRSRPLDAPMFVKRRGRGR